MVRLEKENEILRRRLESDEKAPPTDISQERDEEEGDTVRVQLAEKS